MQIGNDGFSTDENLTDLTVKIAQFAKKSRRFLREIKLIVDLVQKLCQKLPKLFFHNAENDVARFFKYGTM